MTLIIIREAEILFGKPFLITITDVLGITYLNHFNIRLIFIPKPQNILLTPQDLLLSIIK